MFKSCKYGGRIHPEGFRCPSKPNAAKKNTKAVQFRNSTRWQDKREQIKKRDKYCCQIRVRELYGTTYKCTYEDLQVHHAVPILVNEELKLDSGNLITLCPMHHSMCDKGQIPCAEVKKIINEQESLYVDDGYEWYIG